MAEQIQRGKFRHTLRSRTLARLTGALLFMLSFFDVQAFLRSSQECQSFGGFWCNSSQRCISKRLRCNNFTDCGNNEDEYMCNGTGSGAGMDSLRELECRTKAQYWCHRSKTCIQPWQKCDRKIDCANGEDEKQCVYVTTASVAATEQTSTQKTDFTALTSAIAGVLACLTVLVMTAVVRFCCLKERQMTCERCSLEQGDRSSRLAAAHDPCADSASSCSQLSPRSLTASLDPPSYDDVAHAPAVLVQADQLPPAYDAACNPQLHHSRNMQMSSNE